MDTTRRIKSGVMARLIRVVGLALIGFLMALRPGLALDFPVVMFASHAQHNDGMSVLRLDFDKEAEVTHHLLSQPHRLVLDFAKIGYGFQPDTGDWRGLVSGVRWGDISATQSRIIFEMSGPFAVHQIRWVRPENEPVHRLEVIFAAATEAEFAASVDETLRTSSIVQTTRKSDRLGATPLAGPKADGDFVVILDPGHGGIDSGAVGKGGTLEKDITLTFAKELKARLDAVDGIDVRLTRDSDVFVRLNDRVRFARQNGGALLVSIHADSVRQSYVRGATVYTISDRASDQVAAQVAESENLSDEIAGLTVDNVQPDVVDILVDLARRETLGFSVQFARLAIEEMGSVARLIKNAHRHAGFRVLKAPDVPSVLVELGYLSNQQDEALLNDPVWRDKMESALMSAILRYAELSGRTFTADAG